MLGERDKMMTEVETLIKQAVGGHQGGNEQKG